MVWKTYVHFAIGKTIICVKRDSWGVCKGLVTNSNRVIAKYGGNEYNSLITYKCKFYKCTRLWMLLIFVVFVFALVSWFLVCLVLIVGLCNVLCCWKSIKKKKLHISERIDPMVLFLAHLQHRGWKISWCCWFLFIF